MTWRARRLLAAGATLTGAVILALLVAGPEGPGLGRPAGAQAPARPAPPSSATCEECHAGIEPMHEAPNVRVTCTECHGGDGTQKDKAKSHVLPRNGKLWKTSANPGSTYGEINLESPEFIRFMNPSDLRVADQTCGGSGCHGSIVTAVRRSVMATNPMVFHAGLYNNGVEPSKIPMYGEAFAPLERDGKVYYAPARIRSLGELTPKDIANGVLKELFPVPRFEISMTNDPFRILERGNVAASIRGPGTEAKISGVVLTISKTRLNDPGLWLQGPNEVGGDYRQSGCAACHVVYANDREEANSVHFAEFGNRGLSASADPTIPKKEPGHPIKHRFTRRIPSAQCMSCHHHQGNGALGMYQGYMWWDQESDYDRVVGLGMGYPWWDPTKKVLGVDPPYKPALDAAGFPVMSELAAHNREMKHVQFNDAHGHGWHFVRIYKRDRYGRLLDGQDRVVPDSDPERFAKAVHLKDIHLEKGMDCIDCHGNADSHGGADGKLYSQMRDIVAIRCKDCHGTPTERATLITSGPTGGWDLAQERTQFGTRWMQRRGDTIIQNSKMKEGLSWEVRQVFDSIDPAHPLYSPRSARGHALRKDGSVGPVSTEENLAHKTSVLECASCHASWNTGCYGCHITVRVNTKTKEIHVADTATRAYPDYFPQVIRPDITMLGVGGRPEHFIAPFRASNPVIVTVTDRGRNVVVHEQPTVSSPGFSGFAFTSNPPHTIRTRETRDCEDCHVSKANDNNAWLAAMLGFGTNAANFIGDYAYVAVGSSGVQAVRVAEGYEPRPVIGSWLHSVAYPADYQRFVADGRRLTETHRAGSTSARSLVRRGEFLFVADGSGGLGVYDIAQIANKSAAQRIIPAPFSPLGNRVRLKSADATAVALAASNPMDLDRKSRPENLEQPVAPIFRYAFVTDSIEGLLVTDVNTFTDGNPVNNYLTRATTYNPNGALTGARNIAIAGNHAYIGSPKGLHVVDLTNPTSPNLVATVAAPAVVEPRAVQVQFRYAFVVDREGLKVLDVTNPAAPRATGARVAIPDARDIHVMRTYAYIAAGAQGLAIVDVERPEVPGAPVFFTAGGAIDDATAVTIGATYVGQYAYVADGKNGLRVVKLIDTATPGFIGWGPAPTPELIASVRTAGPALSVAEGYKRDRAVDESGNQIGISNRLGAHPFNARDLDRVLKRNNELITVENSTPRVRR